MNNLYFSVSAFFFVLFLVLYPCMGGAEFGQYKSLKLSTINKRLYVTKCYFIP